jgi:hypothetical protein
MACDLKLLHGCVNGLIIEIVAFLGGFLLCQMHHWHSALLLEVFMVVAFLVFAVFAVGLVIMGLKAVIS